MLFRSNFYIKDPGRELGGNFAFFDGFRMDAWTATFILIFTIPAFLHLVYFILTYYGLEESSQWDYVRNRDGHGVHFNPILAGSKIYVE